MMRGQVRGNDGMVSTERGDGGVDCRNGSIKEGGLSEETREKKDEGREKRRRNRRKQRGEKIRKRKGGGTRGNMGEER